jgi:hypothetical protein
VLLNFEKVSSVSQPILSAVEATSCICFLRSIVRGVDGVDYNMSVLPGYRVMTSPQNTIRCFRRANQHSLLPARAPRAAGACATPMHPNGAPHAPECARVHAVWPGRRLPRAHSI